MQSDATPETNGKIVEFVRDEWDHTRVFIADNCNL